VTIECRKLLTHVLVVTDTVTVMQIASRFAVAVHMLILADECSRRDAPCSSAMMAGSVNTNPVVIRRITGLLKKASLAAVRGPTIGLRPMRPLEDVRLLDVYRAVGAVGEELFGLQHAPNPACPVGAHINEALGETLAAAQAALEDSLASLTVRDVLDGIVARAKKG
jgi:DNA-binding IscR family transcriptional regulator